ncbi:Polyhydroxyalkanoate synthesis regulator phasin [Streptococcus henryi]|jgi:polyhydroxyalkanoate synthesis regulator phasin|uniref:Polyhydroxyalkanoate synthesis regulator phasin n=2 Tax=Streptococcus henryi TaxID=439219 RepID=A0A1G6A8I3_9STRE|nr:Polyhydroxyalkanoate synthesis regulator phasin [Streptococcus henryi]
MMDELKKVLLAGIGLTSMTIDKADDFVKELVEKGRLTIDEGKELQQELKRKSEGEAQAILNKVNEKTQNVQYATKEDMARLEDKLDKLTQFLNKSE